MAPGPCAPSGCHMGLAGVGLRGGPGRSGKVLDAGHSSPSSWGVGQLGPRPAVSTQATVSPAPSESCPLWPLTGTFVSAFAVLCGARTDLPDRHVCCVFWLNIAAALIQTLTAIVMVGWIMSIFWGMDMVILASE